MRVGMTFYTTFAIRHLASRRLLSRCQHRIPFKSKVMPGIPLHTTLPTDAECRDACPPDFANMAKVHVEITFFTTLANRRRASRRLVSRRWLVIFKKSSVKFGLPLHTTLHSESRHQYEWNQEPRDAIRQYHLDSGPGDVVDNILLVF